MPWKEATVISERHEFVTLAKAEGANIAALCRRFGIIHVGCRDQHSQ